MQSLWPVGPLSDKSTDLEMGVRHRGVTPRVADGAAQDGKTHFETKKTFKAKRDNSETELAFRNGSTRIPDQLGASWTGQTAYTHFEMDFAFRNGSCIPEWVFAENLGVTPFGT